MKLQFLTENIDRHLSLINKNTSTSNQVPILTNILLKATSTGFTLQATDLELGVEVKIPAKIEEEGEITVPGRQFIEVLSGLPKDKITLEKKDDILHLTSRKNKIKFQTTSSEEFPTLFEEEGDLLATYTSKELETFFSKILFSAAVDDTRPEITGILLKQFEDHVEVVTTDGFRLSRMMQKEGKIGEEEDTLIIPRKLIDEVIAQKSTSVHMFVNKKGHQIIFRSEDVTIVGRMLHGNYPNYERVIPTSSSINVELPREDVLGALKLSSVFARENSNIVKCSMKGNTLTLTSRASSLGEQESELDINKEGEDIDVSFNAKYLQDALRACASETVTLELTTPQEAAVFKDEKNEDFLHVVMPVRV